MSHPSEIGQARGKWYKCFYDPSLLMIIYGHNNMVPIIFTHCQWATILSFEKITTETRTYWLWWIKKLVIIQRLFPRHCQIIASGQYCMWSYYCNGSWPNNEQVLLQLLLIQVCDHNTPPDLYSMTNHAYTSKLVKIGMKMKTLS